MKKLLLSLLFILWLEMVLAVFFVVQKPDFFRILKGLGYFFLTVLIPVLMAIVGGAAGMRLLPNGATPPERFILGIALGLTGFGLAGFALAITGLAKPLIVVAILLALIILLAWAGNLKQFGKDAQQTYSAIASSARDVPPWIPLGAGVEILLAFILGLAPPAEDFDALLYHLTVPSLWLKDGGLTYFAMPHYWFPQIVEGSFVWPMAFRIDTAAHLIHLLWFVLTVALLWLWAHQVWGSVTAWNSILLLLTMPSLAWLAAWAYTDFALTFAGLAMLYALWRWQATQYKNWLAIGGIMAGVAVSVKYTGVIVPVIGMILIFLWENGISPRLRKAFYFGLICMGVATPWYVRNWLWMGNPIYPFLFGGRFWDSFLAQAYSASGSGMGWNPMKLFALPLTAALGTQDMNFFDGRIGPFFLILLPAALWAFWESRQEKPGTRRALLAIGLFSLASIAFWTVGVVNSAHLFQTRLLIPALIPLAIPLALGMKLLPKMDARGLKASFILRVMLLLVVSVNLLDLSLQILARNPISAALGITSRQIYMEKISPGYTDALELVNKIPVEGKVYFLFEPRSYGMNTSVQPDAINANFAHDLWLYKTPENILEAWKQNDFTYVLLSKTGAEFVLQNETFGTTEAKLALEQVETLLIVVEESQDGNYVLYKIP